MPAITSVLFIRAFMSGLSLEYSWTLILRLLPILFEMFLPVHGPGSAEVIDEPGVPEDQLGWPAIRTIDDRALDAAFHKRVPCIRIETRGLVPLGPHVKWLLEGLRIVERLL